MYEIVNKLMDALEVVQAYLRNKHEKLLNKRIHACRKGIIECEEIIAKLKVQQNVLQMEIEELKNKRIL